MEVKKENEKSEGKDKESLPYKPLEDLEPTNQWDTKIPLGLGLPSVRHFQKREHGAGIFTTCGLAIYSKYITHYFNNIVCIRYTLAQGCGASRRK